jgi:stage III sporulation protein AA
VPLSSILPYLPLRAAEILLKYPVNSLYEIRLRANRPMTVTTTEGNLPTGITLSDEELSDTVLRLCSGSLHAYEDTMREGYIPLPNGGRVGLCGTLSGDGITAISSLCLRVPRTIRGIGAALCRRLLDAPMEGMLLYSPPGEGKTTLLRDIAVTLSSPPHGLRVAVIDSRREIYREDAFRRSVADVYTGYPKAAAMEIAIRTMSPQYLLCDELGAEEAESVLAAQNAGVPLIASAHAPSFDALMRRPAFVTLHRAAIFGFYVGLRREGRGFFFDVMRREEVSL